MEQIQGSDHRPVYSIVEVEKKGVRYIKLDPSEAEQGVGILKFSRL